jgi:competence protein ComEC
MKISLHGTSLLLTGDITASAESMLIGAHGARAAAHVIQAPHHGSSTSSTKVFVDAVRPNAVVIPAGWRNRFGFPHPTVLRRYRGAGAAVWRIDDGGAVVLDIAARGWRCTQPASGRP